MAAVVLWGGWATAVAAWGPCGPPQGQQPFPRHMGGWCVGWVGMGRGVVVARVRTVAARLLCWWLNFPRSAGKQERRCNGVKMASTEVAEVAGGLGHGVHSLQPPQTPATARASANCTGLLVSQVQRALGSGSCSMSACGLYISRQIDAASSRGASVVTWVNQATFPVYSRGTYPQ